MPVGNKMAVVFGETKKCRFGEGQKVSQPTIFGKVTCKCFKFGSLPENVFLLRISTKALNDMGRKKATTFRDLCLKFLLGFSCPVEFLECSLERRVCV